MKKYMKSAEKKYYFVKDLDNSQTFWLNFTL